MNWRQRIDSFGNQRQIELFGPVTVKNPRHRRSFMTIPGALNQVTQFVRKFSQSVESYDVPLAVGGKR